MEGIASLAGPESLLAPFILNEPDLPPHTNSELSRSVLHELGQGTLVPSRSTDSHFLVHTSPLNEALDLMRSLAIMEESLPNYAQPALGVESREFYIPPTTHFINTIEDLTDMLDYSFEDINGMDNDAGEEQSQNPPLTGRWTATSTYDVYMVDTPK